MDKHFVYRPLLDLIGYTEGTDERDGYNETLGYGVMLDGKVTPKGVKPRADLTSMTLKQIDALQTQMLKDPDNRWNSSAIGRYQIVRKTRRSIEESLPSRYPSTRKFDEDCQDEMACYLLGLRGIDKYLAGRLKEDTLINNLAMEWASLPTTQDKGYYDGQNARIKASRVRKALAEVKRRHAQGQPKEVVEIEIDRPVVPDAVEEDVKKNFNFFAWVGSLLGGGGGLGVAAFAGFDWKSLAVLMVGTAVFIGVGLWFRHSLIKAIKEIREAVE